MVSVPIRNLRRCFSPVDRFKNSGLILAALALMLPILSCTRVSQAASDCDYHKGGNCQVSVNGVVRTYALHVPPNFQPGSSGLVIAFHGARGQGAEFATFTQLNWRADRNGYAVAYPDGLPNANGATSWNAYFNPTYGKKIPPDDSAFVRQMILSLEANLRPDPKRIYVTGLSAGAHMAHRAAIDDSDLIAAAAIVEGSLWVQHAGGKLRPPQPKAPVSILILHADTDQIVHYCGVDNGHVTEASQDESFDYWSHADSCKSVKPDASLCTKFVGNPTSVMEKSATDCSAGTEVRFYKLAGGLHWWYAGVPLNIPPGNSKQPYSPALNSSTGTTTNEVIWNFFLSHPKP
jgi:polyhydroxybutyrate depolymerase